ncbi:MAG: hypothetical protein OEY63_04735 [Gemmatimonadota bacterium]|nr:hypothetical protein [Gemmatimonadota bacterium]
MITGSVAAIAYGEPRMTNDVDVVLELKEGDAELLTKTFPPDQYYVPPLEVIKEETERSQHGHFNIIHHDTGLRADIYMEGKDPLHLWAFDRREAIPIEGDETWFAPAEYVIVRKLEFFRESGSDRHLRDIAGMIRISGDRIDRDSLAQLVKERDLDDVWDLASSKEWT